MTDPKPARKRKFALIFGAVGAAALAAWQFLFGQGAVPVPPPPAVEAAVEAIVVPPPAPTPVVDEAPALVIEEGPVE
jgi:hypothetical protein